MSFNNFLFIGEDRELADKRKLVKMKKDKSNILKITYLREIMFD